MIARGSPAPSPRTRCLDVVGRDQNVCIVRGLSLRARESNIARSPMKRFQMITEADARVLDYGSTVVLVRRRARDTAGAGHAEGAADRRRARRATTCDAASLAPTAEIKTVAIAGDHTSVRVEEGDPAAPARRAVSRSTTSAPTPASRLTIPIPPPRWPCRWPAAKRDAGIAIDGAGLGSTIAANKVDGVRAAMCLDPDARPVRPPAQRRQRARARIHARHPGGRARDRRYVPRHADA